MEHPGFFRFKQKFYILEKNRTIHFWIQESEFAFCQKKPSRTLVHPIVIGHLVFQTTNFRIDRIDCVNISLRNFCDLRMLCPSFR